jgi:hypothetical protein
MTDLEITRLCAEARGEKIRDDLSYLLYWHNSQWERYDPLHDDAQLKTLIEHLHLELRPVNDGWQVVASQTVRFPDRRISYMHGTDLSRTVCLCVAKMQEAKNG